MLSPMVTIPLHSQGARSVEEEERDKAKEKSRAFRGMGFRLGDTEAPSQQVQGGPSIKQPEKVCTLNQTCGC